MQFNKHILKAIDLISRTSLPLFSCISSFPEAATIVLVNLYVRSFEKIDDVKMVSKFQNIGVLCIVYKLQGNGKFNDVHHVMSRESCSELFVCASLHILYVSLEEEQNHFFVATFLISQSLVHLQHI